MVMALRPIAAFSVYFALNQKNEMQERIGTVKEILNKHVLFVDFDDRRSSVVKLFGLKMASEREMLDEQIFDLLYNEVKGKRIRVKPVSVDSGEILVSEIYLMADEYLNEILIRQGFARWNPSEAANDRRLSEAQEMAKMHDQGVWNPTVKQLAAEESREAESHKLEIESDSAEEGDRAGNESFASADSEANRERIATGAEAKPHLE
jgi:hypothetical protein